MSHEIDMSNDRANMAYAAGTAKPWHTLGFEVAANATVKDWQKASGLDFTVRKGVLLFKDANGAIHQPGKEFNRSVLYRDDTMNPLSVMSKNRYTIHQPEAILNFVGEVSEVTGWPVNTVGSLYGGRKIWALLKMDGEHELPGGDKVVGHLLATTSFDGSSGSEFRFVSERVVCANTLAMALGEKKRGTTVYHDTLIDPKQVKIELGIADQVWENFIATAKRLTEIHLSQDQAIRVLRRAFDAKPDKAVSDERFVLDNETPRRVLGLFNGAGIGANLASAYNTGWGLVNAVTQDADHFGSNRNSRLNSAWFGPAANRKQAVVDAVLAL